MNDLQSCEKCGGGNMSPGKLAGHYPVAFYPKQRPRLFAKGVPVEGTICLDCGAITLTANMFQLEQFKKSQEKK